MGGVYNFLASLGRIQSELGVYIGYIIAALLVLAAPVYIVQHRERKDPVVPSLVLPILACFLGAFLVLFITRIGYLTAQQSKPYAAFGGAYSVVDLATMPFRN